MKDDVTFALKQILAVCRKYIQDYSQGSRNLKTSYQELTITHKECCDIKTFLSNLKNILSINSKYIIAIKKCDWNVLELTVQIKDITFTVPCIINISSGSTYDDKGVYTYSHELSIWLNANVIKYK